MEEILRKLQKEALREKRRTARATAMARAAETGEPLEEEPLSPA